MKKTLYCRVAALAFAASVLSAAPSTLAEQITGPKRIAFALFGYSADSPAVQAFRQGLRDAGHAEGRDVVLDVRSANADPDRASPLIKEMLNAGADVLVVESTTNALAAKRATRTVPIVLAFVGDPVGSGVVSNLSHPGGNITGLSNMTADLMGKRLQLLKEAVPQARRIGVLWNPDTPWHQRALEQVRVAAPGLGVSLETVAAQLPADIDPAFEALARAKVEGLLLVDGPFMQVHGPEIMRRAGKARLPVVYYTRLLIAHGLLIAYGAEPLDIFRRAAGYVDKILRGAKPGELPIAQPTKFELVINLKAASTLGITVPESLLLRADEVIR
jgi:putative tryptophan/tyrosine transport system substrate-binding protein